MNKMEQITVVYFSPTGGTRKACLNLAMEMGKKVKDVDLCSLDGAYSFGPEDTVIVGVPVFGGRIPGYAAEKLTYLKGNGAVAVTAAVYGNRAFEDALLELDDCLKKQGFKIGAGQRCWQNTPWSGILRPEGRMARTRRKWHPLQQGFLKSWKGTAGRSLRCPETGPTATGSRCR